MSYFANFPLVRLGNGSLGMNITARTKILSKYKNEPSVYYEHSIVDGETPEIVADKFYDDPELAWVVLLFNDIINVYTQWPVDQQSLIEYLEEEYDDPYSTIAYYKSAATGNVVDADHVEYDRIPVTIIEDEQEKNDAKRNIKLVLPELVGSIVQQHKELLTRIN